MPTFRYEARQRQVDYVMLCDVRHYRDQAAWLFHKVFEELHRAGLQISFYDFDRHPERVWPPLFKNRGLQCSRSSRAATASGRQWK